MNILWEGVKATAGIVGQAAVETGLKGKIQAELLLIANEVDHRKRTFGEELYEYVEPLSKTPDFYAANDRMTECLRGPLLTAQREISALDIRRRVILEKVSKTEQSEKTAYVAATNWQDTLHNTAKKAGFVSHHAKLKTELSMVDVQIKDFKQVFGLEMFATLVQLEDQEGWLPTVRDIRSIYDQARRDVEKIQVRQKEKEAELIKLGGAPMVSSAGAEHIDPAAADTETSRPSYFQQVAAAEGGPPIHSSAVVGAAPPAAVQVRGGPLSYSVPMAPPPTPAVSTVPPPQQYPDPFSLVPPQPTQQPVYADPFAASTTNTNTMAYSMNYNAQPTPQHHPFPAVPMGGAAPPIAHDPFAPPAVMGGAAPPIAHDPFAPPAVMGGAAPPIAHDPFAPASFATTAFAAPNPANYDPFAGLDTASYASSQPPPYGANPPPPTSDNPLFRF